MGELSARPKRIVDIAAAAALELLELAPPDGPLSALQLRPAPGGDLVILEVASSALAARLVVEGDCARPVSLPRRSLAVLRRRHGRSAERLVVDQLEQGLGLRSFGADSTVALPCSESPELPALPLLPVAPMPWDEATAGRRDWPGSDSDLPILVSPEALGAGIAVLRRLGADAVELVAIDHPVLCLALVVSDGPVRGMLQLARMVRTEQ